jgi:hypothetical protein
MGVIRWLLIYICKEYSSNLQHYFRSKLKFMYNPTLYFVMTPSMVRQEGKDPQPTEGAWPSRQ